MDAADPKLALRGLDPVALVDGKEVDGKPDLAITKNRFVYHFATSENKAAFAKNPDQYCIQYGGACARMGSLSGQGDPNRFHVHDRKIYIFASNGCLAGFQRAPDQHLDRDDPLPTGTDLQKQLGKKLLDKAAEGFNVGGVAKPKSFRFEYLLEYKSPTQTTVATRQWAWQLPDSISRTEVFGKSVYHLATTPKNSFYSEPKQTWPMEKCEQAALWREALHDPLLVILLRGQPGLVAVALDPVTNNGQALEQVLVGYAGTNVTLAIDPQTGRVHQAKFRGRAASGDTEFVHTFDDFRKVDDLVVPHIIRKHVNGKAVPNPEVKLTSLKVNPELPASTFAPPK